MATTINFTDYTTNVTTSSDNVVTGDGVFDDLMETINKHIEAQYEQGLITGNDYATVYLGAMQSAMQTSMQFLLQKNQAEKQADLVERQTQGFDDDAKQKLLKQTLDSWAVAYSVAPSDISIPDSLKVDAIDSTLKSAFDSLDITVTTNPLGL